MRTIAKPIILSLLLLATVPMAVGGCGGSGDPTKRVVGQSEFQSAPQLGAYSGSAFGNGGSTYTADCSSGGCMSTAPAPAAPSTGSSNQQTTTRTVQETDLYAVEGNRLYYLNGYRGLMVFDISAPDAPVLVGRSPIFGDPQEMTVHNGICVVVVGDWYGIDDGKPFHGSIVRGLDATDPTNITVVGEAHLTGWVRDTRVVGSVLYTVS
jgi:hypothetical protein